MLCSDGDIAAARATISEHAHYAATSKGGQRTYIAQPARRPGLAGADLQVIESQRRPNDAFAAAGRRSRLLFRCHDVPALAGGTTDTGVGCALCPCTACWTVPSSCLSQPLHARQASCALLCSLHCLLTPASMRCRRPHRRLRQLLRQLL